MMSEGHNRSSAAILVLLDMLDVTLRVYNVLMDMCIVMLWGATAAWGLVTWFAVPCLIHKMYNDTEFTLYATTVATGNAYAIWRWLLPFWVTSHQPFTRLTHKRPSCNLGPMADGAALTCLALTAIYVTRPMWT